VSWAVSLLLQVLHLIFMLAVAPFALGLSHFAGARLAGRAGPPPTQPWRDLRRLLRKQTVFAESASGLFGSTPAFAFATILLASSLVPSFALGMATAPLSDLIVVTGLLMLARASLALAAMESGTALGGLGASRSMALAGFTEPALLLVIAPLALLTGSTNLDTIASVIRDGAIGLQVPSLLAMAALAVVAVARLRAPTNAPLPFSEAAMTEDVLAQEYSGRPLALLKWGDALRRLLWLNLLVDVAIPFGLADSGANPLWWVVSMAIWVAKMAVLTVALAVWQVARASRSTGLAESLGLAVLLGLLAAAFLFAGQGLA
jgi:formate hydrogenlyase subunit 4